MTYQGQAYVPLRNMRDNRNERSPQTSYWPLKSEANIAIERNSKGDNGSEGTELWSAIKNVKDYVWSSGSQMIGTIKGLCKTPRSEWKSSSTALQLSNEATQSPMGSLLKNERARDVSMEGWHKFLGETDETASWIKNMMSDPDVSGETKFIICRMVEFDFMRQSGVVPPIFFSNQQRLLPSRSLTTTPRHSLSGSRQISPRRSLYEGTRNLSGFPPLRPTRRLSGVVPDLRAMTPYTQEKSPYHSQAWSTSRASSRRASANFSKVGSPFSVPDTEMQRRYRPAREFGLSPRENQRGMVTYSDPTIARALANFRRGRSAYTKEDFDKYNRAKRSKFVSHKSRLKLSATKKSEQKKRKSFLNRGEPFRTSSAKRSRSGEKKGDIRPSITMDIDSISNCFEPDICSIATTLTQSPIANDDSMRSITSSKDDEVKNRESRMSTDSASQDSLFATGKSGVTANLFGSVLNKAVGSDSTNSTGGLLRNSQNINSLQSISKTKRETSKAKVVSSTSPKLKPSTANLFGNAKAGLFHTKANAKAATNIFAPQTIQNKDHKILDKTLSTKPITEKDSDGKMEVPVKAAPPDKKPNEHVSYACRMAQMRRIKIKEHYTKQIEKLYDCHCKDKDKDTKKKNAVQTYQNKYHKRRQDHMFYTKLCDKYEVKPANEYDGNDPDIKPDEEEEEDEKLPQTKPPEEKPTPLLFGITAGTNDKSAGNINPFANNPFAVKEPAKVGGFNFSGGNLFNQTSSSGKGLFSQHSASSPNGQLKASDLFIGKVISSTPTVSLFGKPIQKEQKPSAFSFDAKKLSNLESKATAFPKKKTEVNKIRVSANEIFRGCDENSLWTHHLEGTIPNSEEDDQPQEDDESTSKAVPLFSLSSSSGTPQTSLFGGKAPAGNMFGDDSNSTLTTAKPLTTPSSNMFSNPVKSSDTGMFGISAAKTNGGSSNNNSGGLFSGTSITGNNMFDVKSGSSSNPFANCSSGSSPATKNIFAINTNSKGPASLFAPNPQASSNNLFSSTSNGMFGTNSNRLNINNKTEKPFSFGKFVGKSNPNGKRRRIVRGRRTMK